MVSEEKMFEIVDRRRPEHGYTISSTCEPNGSGELKMVYEKYGLFFQKCLYRICNYGDPSEVTENVLHKSVRCCSIFSFV